MHSLYESIIVLPSIYFFLSSTYLSTGNRVQGWLFSLQSKNNRLLNKNKKPCRLTTDLLSFGTWLETEKKYLKVHKISETGRGKQRWSRPKGPEMIEDPIYPLFKIVPDLYQCFESIAFTFWFLKASTESLFPNTGKKKPDVFYSSPFL